MTYDSYVLILDYGSQYTQLIARRIREAGVYSEIHPYYRAIEIITANKPAGIVLSGGPASIYDPDSPKLDKSILDLNIPILGICYGLQALAHTLGGHVQKASEREYGRAMVNHISKDSLLFHGLPETDLPVWMSHGDKVITPPPNFRITASTFDTPVAALERADGLICGVQFHPEVAHTPSGRQILENFLFRVAKIKPSWSMSSFIESSIQDVKRRVGDSHVVAGLSGGVDSSVMVALVH
ncbi:MAG: glutamine-hydrolyzing GMP synthase, partial [Deltaproteobacteria bacterium]|nr:glutamine-hydrolyzing GMP synthase [Deltaproteobacteria bacterium]